MLPRRLRQRVFPEAVLASFTPLVNHPETPHPHKPHQRTKRDKLSLLDKTCQRAGWVHSVTVVTDPDFK